MAAHGYPDETPGLHERRMLQGHGPVTFEEMRIKLNLGGDEQSVAAAMLWQSLQVVGEQILESPGRSKWAQHKDGNAVGLELDADDDVTEAVFIDNVIEADTRERCSSGEIEDDTISAAVAAAVKTHIRSQRVPKSLTPVQTKELPPPGGTLHQDAGTSGHRVVDVDFADTDLLDTDEGGPSSPDCHKTDVWGSDEARIRSPGHQVKQRTETDPTALWFELTENFDDDHVCDSKFGLDHNTLGHVATLFSRNERIPEALRHELTEDLGPCDTNWDDSEFGFSDEQLETLWKRFGAGMGTNNLDVIDEGDGDGDEEEFKTPDAKTLSTAKEEQEVYSPCHQALQSVEDALENIGADKIVDSIGLQTLDQFIGESVPDLPRSGMRAFMVSTHNFEGIDWYLFKVTDRGSNRFYMKTFTDFEELNEELERASVHGKSCQLPELQSRDYFGVWKFFGGQDFDAQRSKGLRTYVTDLMSRALSPAQEQVLRLFFGPNSRGRIMPPSGSAQRGQTASF
jgi:hypothetical protein